jgi:transcriptional regulator with XRE-family HTH domain
LNITERLRALRVQRNLSQGDIEKRTGLLRVYISRVENGHTTPSIGTIEKFARALEVPTYQLFYEEQNPPKPQSPVSGASLGWGDSGHEARTFDRFRRILSRTNEADRDLLLTLAKQMMRRKTR